jgi:hypothetical protein
MAETMKTPTDNKNRFVIIMAGGRGERFWPVSFENALLTVSSEADRLQL